MAAPSRAGDFTNTGAGHGDQVFVRRATGLVREGSMIDAAIYNLMWSGIPISLTLLFLFGAAYYADANLPLSVVLAALLCLPIALTYAFLASAMPRSGGDYVWVSRAVHPALGFMSNLSFNFWMIYFFGVYATLLGAWAVSALFRMLAAYTGRLDLLNTADFFVSSWGVFLLGCAVVIIMGGLFILNRGMETFFRLQRWSFVLLFVGSIILAALAVLTAGGAGFVDRFNSYVTALGGPADAHAAVLLAGGAPAMPSTFAGTLLLVTIPYYTMGFIFQSAYFGGEIKRGRGTHMLSMAGSLLLATVVMLIVVWIVLAAIGRDFLAALGLAPDPTVFGLGFVPLFPELGAIASGNVIFGLIILLGFAIGFVAWIPQTTILISRGLFAWSFDRLIPERVAEVNPRTHSPVVATLIIMALSLVSVAILAFNPELSALVGLFGLTLTYLAVSVAGILFPYRQPDVFAASPYPQRIGGVPVVSVIAAVSLATSIVLAVILLRDPNSGTSWEFNRGTVLLAVGVFLAGLPIYYLLRAIQRGRGVDVDLAYKEIPPD
mgnify:CR=1 FL=1